MKYDFPEFLRCIAKYRVTAVPCVPPVAVQLARERLPDDYDLTSLKRIMVAAAPIKAETVATLRKRYHVVVLQTFGCTEVAPTATALNEWHDVHVGSVGKLLPGMCVRSCALVCD
jgi:acyl-coenzyme A synthetase/AMP-(fatty) acid ligase